MKTQILILSLAFMAINSPDAVLTNQSSENGLKKVTKPQSTDFDFFRTHHQGKGITASWGLTTNSGTACFMVQRTYEDPTDPYAFWEDLNYVACTSARSFKWTDDNVFPGYISYRIAAYQLDGSTIYSPINQVRIVSR